jgi:hypothetical protein
MMRTLSVLSVLILCAGLAGAAQFEGFITPVMLRPRPIGLSLATMQAPEMPLRQSPPP